MRSTVFPPSSPPRSPLRVRRWPAVAVGALALVAASCSSGTGTAVKAAEVTRPSGSTSVVTTTTAAGPQPSTTVVTATAASKPVHTVVPHEALYRNGKIYLEGDVPDRKVSAEFQAKAAAVIGAGNVVNDYHIDPAATTPTAGKVVIDEPLLFPTGSADLNPSYDNLVELGVIVMKENPQVTMRVTGYTDNVGSVVANYWLSLARAQSVVDAISGLGIDPKRFKIVGEGPAHPVASNDSPEGRQQNRRIEVELLGLLG